MGVELEQKYKGHPRYRGVEQLMLTSLEDYLKLATIQWAARYGYKLPIALGDDDVKLDVEDFVQWIFGQVDPERDNLVVIRGGKVDVGGG